MYTSIQGFSEAFKNVVSGASSALIVTHANADPDAVASAILAYRILEFLGSRGCIGFPEGVSKVSRSLLDSLKIDFEACGELRGFKACIIVDASNPVQLGEYRDACLSAPLKVLVDHHEPGVLEGLADLRLIDQSASSTSELMVSLVESLGFKLSSSDSTLAASGIIFDSRRFSHASLRTFNIMAKLLEWGCDYGIAVEAVTPKRGEFEDVSRRVALFKALSRLRVEKACRDLILAVTHIGSFESDIANMLVSLGSDIAAVIAYREEAARVSVRVSRRALEAGVKASTITAYIASKYGGEGGGHEAAAMAHIKVEGDVESLTDNIVRSLQGKIGRICQGGSSSGGESKGLR